MAPKAASKKNVLKKVTKAKVKATPKAKSTPKKDIIETKEDSDEDTQMTPKGGEKLTQTSLRKFESEQGGQLTKREKMLMLNEKIDKFKETGDYNFDYNETRCLYNRLNNALKHPHGSDANKAMREIEASGKGKEAKKRVILRAWWGSY